LGGQACLGDLAKAVVFIPGEGEASRFAGHGSLRAVEEAKPGATPGKVGADARRPRGQVYTSVHIKPYNLRNPRLVRLQANSATTRAQTAALESGGFGRRSVRMGRSSWRWKH
jgi:hypothetical protein